MSAHEVHWEELDSWTVSQLSRGGVPRDKLTGSGIVELIQAGLISVSSDGRLMYKGKKVLAKRYTENLLHHYIKVRDIVRNADGSVTIVPATDEYLDMLYDTARPDRTVLNEKEKLAVHLRDVEKKTFKAISEALECSVGGAQTIYNKGALKLERVKRLAQYFNDHPEDRPGPTKSKADRIASQRMDLAKQRMEVEHNIIALLAEAREMMVTGKGGGLLVEYQADKEKIVGSRVNNFSVHAFRQKLVKIDNLLDQLS